VGTRAIGGRRELCWIFALKTFKLLFVFYGLVAVPANSRSCANFSAILGRMQDRREAPENRWMAQKQSSRRIPPEPPAPPARPSLADQPSRFMQLEREVEQECRPQMLAALQRKVDAVAVEAGSNAPACPQCGRPMGHQDTRPATWLAHWGRLQVSAPRYRCSSCKCERRPLLEVLGVESGRICGSLARLLALLATVAPYELAARLADLLLGVTVSAMGVWRVTQRLGQAAANYSEALSQYHADSRSEGAPVENAPPAVVLAVDACFWECKCVPSGDAGPERKNCRRFPPWNKGSFATSKPVFSCCLTNAWRPRRDAAHWSGDSW